jgi:hypothetical protein
VVLIWSQQLEGRLELVAYATGLTLALSWNDIVPADVGGVVERRMRSLKRC